MYSTQLLDTVWILHQEEGKSNLLFSSFFCLFLPIIPQILLYFVLDSDVFRIRHAIHLRIFFLHVLKHLIVTVEFSITMLQRYFLALSVILLC